MVVLIELNNYSLCSKNLDVLVLSKVKYLKFNQIYTRIIILYYLSIIRFIMQHIFMVHLFGVINVSKSFCRFGQA
jgi:hypothetical protein